VRFEEPVGERRNERDREELPAGGTGGVRKRKVRQNVVPVEIPASPMTTSIGNASSTR
jgi:hypothetical protein